MVGQGDRATGTDRDVSTVTALNEGGVAAAVQEQDGLLSPGYAFPQCLLEGAGEDAAVALAQLFPHIADFGLGEGDGAVLRGIAG